MYARAYSDDAAYPGDPSQHPMIDLRGRTSKATPAGDNRPFLLQFQFSAIRLLPTPIRPQDPIFRSQVLTLTFARMHAHSITSPSACHSLWNNN
jgi:hypothetical protein